MLVERTTVRVDAPLAMAKRAAALRTDALRFVRSTAFRRVVRPTPCNASTTRLKPVLRTNKSHRPAAWLGCALLATLAACGPPHPEAPTATPAAVLPPEPPANAIRLYAAASLAPVLGDVLTEFEAVTGRRVAPAFGATGTLAQQVREGSRPGVFLAASATWTAKLDAWGLVEPGTRTDLLGNTLVVVVPRDTPLRPARFDDLADARFARIAIGDPDAVPAGEYAKAALTAAGLWDTVRARLVSAQDVRGALAWAARGEADAGIVYATDAKSTSDVATACEVPAGLHEPVVYEMLLVKGADGAARDLYEFLRTPAAWVHFEEAGFTRP